MPQSLRFSVVIPARNEERFIGRCLESIRTAAASCPDQVEVIVVLNRCTDCTDQIARGFGARIVHEDARNLSIIRNVGARASIGEILVTIDADSAMSPGTFTAIDQALSSGRTVGGGTQIIPERWSSGIRTTYFFFMLFSWITGISGGLFWCLRADFDAIVGFDEKLISAEDIDFARRLGGHGRKTNRPFSTLRAAPIVTSCRKFDAFGDWCAFRDPLLIWRLLKGTHRPTINRFFYDIDR